MPVAVVGAGAGAAAATSREAAARVGVPHQRLKMRDEVQETTRGERVARGELQPELGWLGLPHAACENLRERWGRCRGRQALHIMGSRGRRRRQGGEEEPGKVSGDDTKRQLQTHLAERPTAACISIKEPAAA